MSGKSPIIDLSISVPQDSSRTIFTITAIRIRQKDVPAPDIDPKNVSVPWPVESRCWGFSLDLSEAIRWTEANETDMNEHGYYPWICIEEWKGGLLLLRPEQQLYFQHEGDYEKIDDMGRYVRLAEQPEELRALHERFSMVATYAWS